MKEVCVSCGTEVPEGRMVCKACEVKYGVGGEEQPYRRKKTSRNRKAAPNLFGLLRSGGHKRR